MLKPARKKSVFLNWTKYERKVAVNLRSTSKRQKKKTGPARPHSQISLGIAALVFLMALILLGRLFGFLGSVNQSSRKSSTWDGKSPLNVVVKADNIYLLSYQPKINSLTVIKFPGEIYLDVPYDFGEWSVRSIYDLGQAEKPPMGAMLLKDSVGTLFSLVVDGYLIVDQSSPDFPGLIEQEKKALLPGISLLSKTKTDLNLLEYIRLWWFIKGVRADKLKTVDLEKSDLTKWLLLPDGSRVITLDQIKLRQFEEDRFEDANIKEEALSIGIFNATDYPGLAENAAKIITNLGGRVIFTSNAEEKKAKSIILAKRSYTSDYLSKMLHLDCPVPQTIHFWQKISLLGFNKPAACSSDNNNLDTSRADITIILGEDSFLKYQKGISTK